MYKRISHNNEARLLLGLAVVLSAVPRRRALVRQWGLGGALRRMCCSRLPSSRF